MQTAVQTPVYRYKSVAREARESCVCIFFIACNKFLRRTRKFLCACYIYLFVKKAAEVKKRLNIALISRYAYANARVGVCCSTRSVCPFL